MPTFQRLPYQGPRKPIEPAKAADVLRQPPSCISADSSNHSSDWHWADNREHTVCFTGHRAVSPRDEQLRAHLDELLELLHRQGYRDFLCGGALGFDQIAAEQVIRLREKHPDVRLIFCLPCADQSARWKRADCSRYERLLYLSDETRVLSPHYYDGCMQARNAYMVDHSYLCVACMMRLRGGTLSTVRYAISQDVPVINLAVPGAVAEYRQSL